jgi:hypothetical protein
VHEVKDLQVTRVGLPNLLKTLDCFVEDHTHHRTVQAFMNRPQQTVPGTFFRPTGLVATNSVADQSDIQAKKLCPWTRTSVKPLYFKVLRVSVSLVQGRNQTTEMRR